MAFFDNRQMGKGMNSGSEDGVGAQADMLGISVTIRNKPYCFE